MPQEESNGSRPIGHVHENPEARLSYHSSYTSAGLIHWCGTKGDRAIKLLGIDVGTGGTRALLIDESGTVVASAIHEHEPFASPRSGWAEQDPRDWWKACQRAVRKLLADSRIPSSEIACIGLSGQMHGAVLLDRNDEVLRPALIWCDQRTAAECRYLNETIGPRAPGGADFEPRAHQLHPYQAAVGADQRTRNLAAISQLSAAQGLRPLLSHRGAGNRRSRCLGHLAARCGASPLVRCHARCSGAQPRLPACSP